MTMLPAFWDAALDLDPEAPDEARTMRNCTPDALEALWTRAGRRDIETHPLTVEASYLRPPSTRPGKQPHATHASAQLGSPRGPFSLTARAWFVRGSVVNTARPP